MCGLIALPYDQQLQAKDRRMEELFGEMLRQDGGRLEPILAMEDPFHYRNKVSSPLAPGGRGPNGGVRVLTGMYAPGSHRIIDIAGCPIENRRAQQVIAALPPLMARYGLAPYDEDRHQGFLRYVVVRAAHESGEVLVTLVTNGDRFPASKAFCRDLLKRCPFTTSVVQNVNTARTNAILGQQERRLYGPGFILDTLCGLSFRISSQSFYQVNSVQTARLYETAVALARLDGTQAVLDAYCGTGTIGLVAAKHGAARVKGVDSVEPAIRDARENARHNGVGNAEFAAADAAAYMRGLAPADAPDVVFLDPPRAGCSQDCLEALAMLAPPRIVYISCNPATQHRDAQALRGSGYRVRCVQPVDMFPHTDHIESVMVLEKGES